MNAGLTSERIYGSLRERILDHVYRPGQRLDPALLAHELSSSSTPVRDALNRLTGEGLVTARTSEGFHLPSIDQIELADMYGWSTDIVKIALRAWRRGQKIAHDAEPWPTEADAHAGAATDLLSRLVAASANPEHANALASVQARLRPAYRAETEMLPALAQEMQALTLVAAAGDRTRLAQLLEARRRRRVHYSAEIVRSLYRSH
jgi:DNA-binding transcriptional MocR family regulator